MTRTVLHRDREDRSPVASGRQHHDDDQATAELNGCWSQQNATPLIEYANISTIICTHHPIQSHLSLPSPQANARGTITLSGDRLLRNVAGVLGG